MTTRCLPVDIWLIIFDCINAAHDVLDDIDADSLTILWCVVRNVSPYLRDCIDEYFRRVVLQSMLIDLSYSNINHHGGPAFAHLHVPMRFSHLSPDGTRAVLRQVAYRSAGHGRTDVGSLRGWVPFAERYVTEIRKPGPKVMHKASLGSNSERPAWEKEHMNMRNTLVGDDKTNYLASLRDHTSIGRGYRPPHYVKIRQAVNDTELVSLAVDIKSREISFDWRRTFALFFVEQRFIMLAESSAKQRIHDADLVAAAGRAQVSMHMHDFWNSSSRRARRKRLQPWVNDNKHRMTPEDRLKAEDRVERTKHQVRRNLRVDNLRELVQEDIRPEEEERVPAKCAEDLPYLLQWPWVHDDTYMAPRKPIELKCASKGCSMM